MRVLLVAFTLLGLPLAAEIHNRDGAARAAQPPTGAPTISRPGNGDTVRSVWIPVEGTVPADLLGELREVEIFVNGASKGKGHLRGVTFRVGDVRLDCSGTKTWNSIRAVCKGPSQKIESRETKVLLVPGRLEINPVLSTDAISPSRGGSPSGAGDIVRFHFDFSTPADWSFRLTGGGGDTPVRLLSGKDEAECEFTWGGTDESGAVVEDGEYMYEITASSTCGDAGQAHCCGVITVDTSVPAQPQLLEPVNDDIVSPDFQLRWEQVQNAWFYEVQLSSSASFDPHEVFSTGANRLRLVKRPDGIFYWRVRAVSRAGTPGPHSTARRTEVRKVMKPAISHLGVITKADGLRPEKGETLRITYMANDDVEVTVRIVTPDGSLVRTLLDRVKRDKGAHVEMWDGRDENGELVPSGAYVAAIEVGGTEDVTPFSESRLVTVVY